MIQRLNKRIRQGEGQGGFTLIELLVVVIIIGILVAIAVPSYLKFRENANNNAAKANVRAGLPAVEQYFTEKGSYADIDVAALKAYDAGLKLTVAKAVAGGKYCIESTSNGKADGSSAHHLVGPGGDITAGSCPA